MGILLGEQLVTQDPTKKDEIAKAIQFLPEDKFSAQMMEYYRRYNAGNKVRGPIQ